MISWISFHDIIYHHYPWMVGLVEVYEEITIHSLGFYHQPLGSVFSGVPLAKFLGDPWRIRVAIRSKVSHFARVWPIKWSMMWLCKVTRSGAGFSIGYGHPYPYTIGLHISIMRNPNKGRMTVTHNTMLLGVWIQVNFHCAAGSTWTWSRVSWRVLDCLQVLEDDHT